MRRVAVVLLALLAGCSPLGAKPSPEEIAAMRPAEALTRFIEAAQHRDQHTGEQLAGECWAGVRGWFREAGPKIRDYAVPEVDEPAAGALAAWVDFDYASGSADAPKESWHATLRRDGTGSPWRVCEIYDFGG